jgi:hypothetical protein
MLVRMCAQEYKMVVYEIERFIRKTKAHYRLGGEHFGVWHSGCWNMRLVC